MTVAMPVDADPVTYLIARKRALGYTYAEISKETGLTISAVRYRVKRLHTRVEKEGDVAVLYDIIADDPHVKRRIEEIFTG